MSHMSHLDIDRQNEERQTTMNGTYRVTLYAGPRRNETKLNEWIVNTFAQIQEIATQHVRDGFSIGMERTDGQSIREELEQWWTSKETPR